jgi:riboflavin transporter FmnP
MQILIDFMGWAGSIVLVVAYLLNSIGKLDSQSFAYQFMNFLGGGFLIINTLFYGAYPSSFLNTIWAIIAGAYLLRLKNQQYALTENKS